MSILNSTNVPKRTSKVYSPASHNRENYNRLADAQSNTRARPPHMEIMTNINISCLRPPKESPSQNQNLQGNLLMPNEVCSIRGHGLLVAKHVIHTLDRITINQIDPPKPHICRIMLQRNIMK